MFQLSEKELVHAGVVIRNNADLWGQLRDLWHLQQKYGANASCN